MVLRHCYVCGPNARHSALLMHRLDGLQSAYDRVVWLCGLHWVEAQKSPVLVEKRAEDSATKSGDFTSSEPVMVLISTEALDRVLEAVA